ncbi:hypothetical protein Cob_v005350 [Colletotrichum orbiculare MAFF 240422]|uniref:Uncharacterized protein n=1 Tax=Colletotrichum orbiculare (strain 104-T / ATCC 96160 / CBS 514.97 / LARS 414 / MAFF 240422) TaxID=1213857 RepID=A0A484FVJ1_COLOR|nr:hypothetical protein Cob_v005350 [Colletotrichum orbiculare MAFF 240422]
MPPTANKKHTLLGFSPRATSGPFEQYIHDIPSLPTAVIDYVAASRKYLVFEGQSVAITRLSTMTCGLNLSATEDSLKTPCYVNTLLHKLVAICSYQLSHLASYYFIEKRMPVSHREQLGYKSALRFQGTPYRDYWLPNPETYLGGFE